MKNLIKRSRVPKDVVVLHQFPRGLRAPSISPLALKLETWLRMANIKYQNNFTYCVSPKGQMPWLTYKGHFVSDSDLCLKFLMKEFDVDLSQHLSESDKSVARAFAKMNEESLRWVSLIHRSRYGIPRETGARMQPLLFRVMARNIIRAGFYQGYGRYDRDEMYRTGMADLKAIETFLEGKTFFMGDTVCNEDATMFGMLCQVIYHDNGPLNKYVKDHCPNIMNYVEIIKNTYWPDWNDQIKEKTIKI